MSPFAGIAKTGSGKTLAFLLPMYRHVLDQPELDREDGPIGKKILILHTDCWTFNFNVCFESLGMHQNIVFNILGETFNSNVCFESFLFSLLHFIHSTYNTKHYIYFAQFTTVVLRVWGCIRTLLLIFWVKHRLNHVNHSYNMTVCLL